MDQNNWNLGDKGRKNLKRKLEKAVLVVVHTPKLSQSEVNEHLDELAFLSITAGARACERFIQKRESPHRKTYIGSGKQEEIHEYIEKHDIDLAIFDDDLSPSQQNNLEKNLQCKIVDRSSLILDIFASRAQTSQAKTQVELAQLQYILPRLRGMWTHLERQRGGIGMRGPGEKEIETDRRIIRDKIAILKKKLEKIDRQEETRRKQRGDLIRVALVGYTNVGKSTLMNTLSKSDLFAENKLFATLDTTVRKVVLDTTPFLLSDTVGFIRKLPHHLVESFKSTLDEVKESDLLLHVVDISHPHFEDHILTVEKTLKDLNVENKETILVFNKIDKYRNEMYDELVETELKEEHEKELLDKLINRHEEHTVILISASEKENIGQFRLLLKDRVIKKYEERYPYQVKNFS
jgi:GTP-binding protein HflX